MSRESGSKHDELEDIDGMSKRHSLDQENTAGVGTQSYASPEQLNGKDYDSSSDVYSLGIILFELCYPMKTGMERSQVFRGIKDKTPEFPSEWHDTIAKQFPNVHNLLVPMLSHDPQERPSAADVVNHIESLLSEYTIQSLDRNSHGEGYILLRIEAEDNEGVLGRTVKLITDSSSVKIVQYSLKGQDSKAIMEFALDIDFGFPENDDVRAEKLNCICQALNKSKEINVVRQLDEEKGSSDKSTSRSLSL